MNIAGYQITSGPRPFEITVSTPAQRRAQEARDAEMARQGDMMRLHQLYSSNSWRIAGGGNYAIGTHPVLNLWHRTHGYGVSHRTQMELFHVLRMMIPVIGSAISKRRQLEGAFVVETKDRGLRTALQEFIDYVPVGSVEGGSAMGLNVYLDGIASAADEFGMGVGEAVFDDTGRTLEYLLLADMRTFSLREVPGTLPRVYQLIQLQDGVERDIAGAMVDRIAFCSDGTDPWPKPMIFGLETLSEIVVRMYNAVNNLWMRVGDPSYLNQIVYDKEARIQNQVTTKGPDGTTQSVDANLFNFQQALGQINQAKVAGLAGDINMSIVGGEIKTGALFDHPATASVAPYLHEHYPVIAGEIIDASDVPPWMFSVLQKAEGLGSSRSQTQAALAIASAKQRQIVKGRIGRRVLDTFLLSIGAGQFVGRYEYGFEETSIIDRKMEAEADRTEAEAALKWMELAMELFTPAFNDAGNPIMAPEMVRFLEDKGVI